MNDRRIGTPGQAFLAMALLATGALPAQKPAAADPARPADTNTAAPADPKIAEALPASVDPNAYRIGAEDVIRVQVWKEPELSFVAAVRPDGMVTAPLLGDLKAVDRTPVELAAMLKEKFSDLVNNPLVSVEVASVRSKKYYMMGNVARTGAFPLVVPTRVMEALTMAGGLSEWADKKKIVIMRGEKRFFFNYDAMVKGKKGKYASPENNILLENGDFVIVN